MLRAHKVNFTGPRKIEIREDALPSLNADEVLVETVCSAISAGTEMLVYRGEFPTEVEAHDEISSQLCYPLAYGYACAGVVRETGTQVDKSWQDRRVFAFQPHSSHFVARPDSLFPIPDSLSFETACFLPNVETAVNLVQDAAPILGERVLVLGQGVIGLLTASLLNEFPLEALVTVDPYRLRRDASLELGLTASLDPTLGDFHEKASELLKGGADLAVELCGSPSGLNDAIALTRFSGRIVIGSWYGGKKEQIDLGGGFHRSRIKLISSQVSTISPELSGRWDKPRRFEVAWNALKRIQPEKWITHRFKIRDASEAFELLDKSPQDAIQIVFFSPLE